MLGGAEQLGMVTDYFSLKAPIPQSRKRAKSNLAFLEVYREQGVKVEVSYEGDWVPATTLELIEDIPSRLKVLVKMEHDDSEKVFSLDHSLYIWLKDLRDMCLTLGMLTETVECGFAASKTVSSHTALYKQPYYPAIFGRAHDFCTSMMDKKAGKDAGLLREVTGETDEPEEDSASLCEFSDLDSEDMDIDKDLADVEHDAAEREVLAHVRDNISNCPYAVAASILDESGEYGEFQMTLGKHELCGKPVLRLLAEDPLAEFALDCHFNRVAQEGANETITAPLRCKTGELISKTWTMQKVTVRDVPLVVLMHSSTQADGFEPADLFTA
ncbi:hypothetical protein AK812_SmicGene15908 [Symbiodinium microadriaticum]|uniref:Uncharacterized protein n=1 Tax=Symbiodinium microadriaticum TaxID=2951 RepID=A0A1Q9E1Q3_SYMMI|nr:hypothetical protein AK812_SmicGene15908 [Symbiodinium microadriaticum]